MLIERIEIDKINPAKYNPRKDLQPGDPEYEKLKKSIAEFDLVEPLIMNKRGNVLVGGHQRLKVLQELGHTETDVSIVDLPPEKEKALNLALNKISGEWDNDKLAELLQELQGAGVDMDITGFDQADMDDLFNATSEPAEIIEDEVPDLPEEPTTKLGDLWTLGRHRLLCGDSTKAEDVEILMNGEKADMVFTDPPYNIGFSYNEYDDKISYDDYKAFCRRFYNLLNCERVIITPGPKNLIVWHDILEVKDIGWLRQTEEGTINEPKEEQKIYDEGLWYKPNTRSGASVFNLRQCEPIIFYGKFKKKRNFDLFSYNRVISKELTNARKGKIADGEHAPGKPVLFVAEILKCFSEKEEKIKDVFGGNGTTLIAAEQLTRTCYMMELDPKYCDVIIQRWENLTGKKAELSR